jgi:hypothetical protein
MSEDDTHESRELKNLGELGIYVKEIISGVKDLNFNDEDDKWAISIKLNQDFNGITDVIF